MEAYFGGIKTWVFVDLEPQNTILVSRESKNQRVNWVFRLWVFGDELGGEIAVEDGDMGGDEGGGTGFAGSSSLAEWGLIAVPELVSFPGRD